MERKFYTDNFEQLLKEKSDEFRMYPSKRVWHSIYNDLHPARKWPSLAVSLLLIIALFFTGYWNNNYNSPSKTFLADDVSINSIEENANDLNSGITPPNNISNNNLKLKKANKNVIQQDDLDIKSASIKTSNTTTNSPASAIIPLKKKKSEANFNAVLEDRIFQQSVKIDYQKNTTPVSEYNSDQKTVISKDNVSENIIEVGNINKKINSIADVVSGKTTDINSITPENKNDINLVTKNSEIQGNSKSKTALKSISNEDRAWIDDYAFYNKSSRSKWKERTAFEFYITPSIGFRKNSDNTKYEASTTNSLVATPFMAGSSKYNTNQKPSLGFEAGAGIVYAIAKNIRLKAGIQGNYTNYVIHADETNHPILTTILLNDVNTGNPYIESRVSSSSNSSGLQSVKIHNKTYQISLPVGFAYKLTGNNKIEWYAGATIQPTYVFGGKANLLSFDKRNYVSDASLIRSWNLNTGFETYIHYKFAGYTLQAGPQFRYQIVSTYSQKFTINENLYNTGLKIGLLKNF